MDKGFNVFNIGLIVVGAILITAGIKGVAPKQVLKDSVSSVKGDKPITITPSAATTPEANKGNAAIATSARAV